MANDIDQIASNGAFCTLPWLHDFRNLDGKKYMCCVSHQSRQTLSEDFNGPERQALRQKLWAGEPIPHCEPCYKLERDGVVSWRQSSNQEWLGKPHVRAWFENLTPDAPAVPRYYDLRYNSKCNLSCISCSPEFSTLWKQELNIPITEYRLEVDPVAVLQSDKIYFAGGEPLIIDEYLALIRHLADNSYQGYVSINTNLTSLKPEVVENIKRLNNVSLIVSVDSAGRTEEFVRYPKRWNKFLDNLRLLQDNGIEFNFNTVASAVSVLGWYELPLLAEFKPKNWWIVPCETPPNLQVQNIPQALKNYTRDIIAGMQSVQFYQTDEKFRSSLDHILKRVMEPGDVGQVLRLIQPMEQRRGIDHADYLGINLRNYQGKS